MVGELETRRGYMLSMLTSRTNESENAGGMEGRQVISLLPTIEEDLGMKCGRFVADGKNLPKDFKSQHPETVVHSDGWHYRKKAIGNAFLSYVTEATGCITTPAKAKIAGQYEMTRDGIYATDNKGKRIPRCDNRDEKSQKMRVREDIMQAATGLQFQFQRVVEVSNGDIDTMITLWRGYIFHLMGSHDFCTNERIGLSSMGASQCQGEPPVFHWRQSVMIMVGFLHGIVDRKAWAGVVSMC
jgi:hypothetical protein